MVLRRGVAGAVVHVGTSGWTYDDWNGPFYPAEVAGAERLSFYARMFDTVEVNSTFYRLPYESLIVAWNRRLPPGFALAVKGSRTVTHLKKLADCDEPLARFCERIRPLRALQVILWQLPPSLHKDIGRLTHFLARLPEGVRHAVEFRHPSWWDDEVARILGRRGAAFVAVSHPQLPEEAPVTADFLYVRFHGKGSQLYDYDYTAAELESWTRRLAPQLPGRTLFAYFNNDWRANAPRNALTFRGLLAAG
jgi:uncharacterized protein YecE (DUF72 family)